MRNFTPDGRLKVSSSSGGSGAEEASFGALLRAGFLTPLLADTDGIALLQPLSATADADGLALAQAPTATTPLVLEAAAAALIPPRWITLTSIADLSAITFAVVGQDSDGGAQNENLAGPAGAPQDADGIALAQTPAAATSLALEAAAANLVPPRLLTFTSAGDLSGVSFEIIGLDEGGDPQTVPAFAGPNNQTLTTVERWNAVTSITPNATSAITLTVGWPDTSATVMSLNAYSAVNSITPDGSSVSNVQAGWPDSTQSFPLKLTLGIFDPSRRVTLTSSANLSGLDFQLSGTDAQGASINEILAGPNNTTVTSVARFAALTAISPLTLGTGTLSAGWPDEAYSLYVAPTAVEISHLYARNTNALLQTVDMTLVVDGVEIPWLIFDLDEDEVVSLFRGEAALPLSTGNEIRVMSTTPGAVSFTLHGREQTA